MNEKPTLPDPDKFFGIRFESIGGLGAHAAGQILATTAVLRMGLNGAHFSSYGAEIKGSVVRSYIRLASPEKAIRSSAPIESPDVIVVFHSALLKHPATLAGMKAGGTLIYNGTKGEPPAELSRLPSTTKVIRVDAQSIAVKERSRANAVLLGTLTSAIPFLDFSILLKAFSDEFALRHPEAVASNEKAFRRGAKEFENVSNVGKGSGDLPIIRPTPVWGYETAPIGGILPTPGNTVWNDLTVSRMGSIPIFHPENCIHCGMCDMVCPDLCLVWKAVDNVDNGEVHLKGVDYRYCKGCIRCVETCPTGGFRRKIETPGLADRLRVPLFPELEGDLQNAY
jgi:pyruvate ferredoxin oxidoreductase gamma subunit